MRLARGDTLEAVVEFCASHDFKVSLRTLGTHRSHITDPRTTFVEAARKNPAIRNGVTNDDFLQAVTDAALAKIEADPDSVNVSHGLKAVAIREARKAQQANVLILIAQAFTGQVETTKPELIEGSYTLLPPVEEIPIGSQ